ncbi:MAG: 5-dehydro-4-deoxyglucarate dehydratase, partial [Nocardioidaceae bacterium]
VPDFAVRFYDAVRADDTAGVVAALREFVIPYCDLRNRRPGYPVSIIKAGLAVVGRPAGGVRAPLSDLADDELLELEALVKKVS